MGRLQFYFEHSLLGYFCRRAKEKWFAPPPPVPPGQLDYNGVLIQLDCLPQGMHHFLLTNQYECAEMKLLSELLSPSDQVLEIGAAIGFVGLYCRKILKVRELVSVEPNPKTLSYLKRNYELNGIAPVVIEAAIAPADGPVSFYVNEMFWTDSMVQRSNIPDAAMTTVEGLSFGSIMQRVGSSFNTLVVDVEGAEQYLPIESIPNGIKKIVIEIHPEVIGIRPAYRILETLIRSGFEVHGHMFDCWALVRN